MCVNTPLSPHRKGDDYKQDGDLSLCMDFLVISTMPAFKTRFCFYTNDSYKTPGTLLSCSYSWESPGCSEGPCWEQVGQVSSREICSWCNNIFKSKIPPAVFKVAVTKRKLNSVCAGKPDLLMKYSNN